MKKIISFLLVLILTVCLFASCSKAPGEPATTGTEAVKYENDYNRTNDEIKSVVDNITFVQKSYYKYKDNYASISYIHFDSEKLSTNMNCIVNIDKIHFGDKDDNMIIGYKAYNDKNELVRDSFIQVSLKGVKLSKTIENIRFTIPFDTVKVEFSDYE